MKRAEVIIVVLIIVALLLSLIPVPGSVTIFVISIFTLINFYFYLGFLLFNNIPFRKIFKKEAYLGVLTNHILGAVGAGIALSMACVAILFKLQYWPGSTVEIIGALLTLTTVLIISIVKIKGLHRSFYQAIVKRVIISGVICLLLLFMPGIFLMKIRYRNHPAYIEALKLRVANPHDKELWKREREEWEKINHHD